MGGIFDHPPSSGANSQGSATQNNKSYRGLLMARAKPIALMTALALTAVAAFTLSRVASSADTPNPFVGTWLLNVAKSTFDPPPPLKSNTSTTTEVSGGGFHTVIDVVEGDGSTNHMEYTIPPGGGKVVPVTGSAYADSIMLTQVGSRT